MTAVGTAGLDSAGFDSVLRAAQAGAPWAFRALYEDLAPALLGYARARGASDPEGAVNDAFLRAFSRLNAFEGDAKALRSWMFTIAHNLMVDERRRRGRRPAETLVEVQVEAGAAPSAEDGALDALGREEVLALLARLPRDQREVLALRLVADLTVTQVATAMGRSAGAVKALQRRGLARLQRMLEEVAA